MHFEALRRPEAANQRFIAFSERLFEKEVGDVLNAEFGPKAAGEASQLFQHPRRACRGGLSPMRGQHRAQQLVIGDATGAEVRDPKGEAGRRG